MIDGWNVMSKLKKKEEAFWLEAGRREDTEVQNRIPRSVLPQIFYPRWARSSMPLFPAPTPLQAVTYAHPSRDCRQRKEEGKER
jgi:hypothetical protein